MSVPLLGLEVVDAWRAQGARVSSGNDATLASPDDTNSFALLVRQAVEALAPRTVLDVGCGCGIPTLEALAAGAERAIGLDVLPANLVLTRRNATRAGLGDRVSTRLMGWGEGAADVLARESIELVVANPPYLPQANGLAVDGGPDGTRLLRSIIGEAARFTRALALLFGSLSNPLAVLEALGKSGWRVRSMFAHAVQFGRYTSAPATLRALHRLKLKRTAFFANARAQSSACAPHAYLVLGVVATRGHARASLLPAVTALLDEFAREGVQALSRRRLVERFPVPFAVGRYYDDARVFTPAR